VSTSDMFVVSGGCGVPRHWSVWQPQVDSSLTDQEAYRIHQGQRECNSAQQSTSNISHCSLLGSTVQSLTGVITSLCLDTLSARIVVGHLVLPAQLPGTHWAMICMIWC